MLKYRETDEGVTFTVRVPPRASRSAVAGEIDGALKLRLAAAPVEGEANAECVRFLARLLGVPQANVKLVSGLRSTSKVVRVYGVTARQLEGLVGGD